MQVIGLSADTMGLDDDETLAAFVAQTGVTFPIGYDLSGSYDEFKAAVASISPYPVDVILDRDGTVAFMAGEYDAPAMAAVLDQLLP